MTFDITPHWLPSLPESLLFPASVPWDYLSKKPFILISLFQGAAKPRYSLFLELFHAHLPIMLKKNTYMWIFP
jgi:hypothetical protein